MRSRTLVLAITTALLVGAGPAQAHGGHHHKRHKPRAVDVQLLSINDLHGHLAPGGTYAAGRLGPRPGGPRIWPRTHGRAPGPQHACRRRRRRLGAPAGLGHVPRRADHPGVERDGRRLTSSATTSSTRASPNCWAAGGSCHPVTAARTATTSPARTSTTWPPTWSTTTRAARSSEPYEIRRVRRRQGRLHRRRPQGHADDRHPSGVEGLTFGDEADAINKYTAKLQEEGVRAIVVLMHQGDTVGLGAGQRLHQPGEARWPTSSGARARRSTSYLTGHTHQAYNCVIAGKRATSASSFGRVLTDANLRVDRRTGQVVSVSAANQIVTQDVAKDPAQTAILDKYTTIDGAGRQPQDRHRDGGPDDGSERGRASRCSATSSPTPSSRPRPPAASATPWWRS